MFIYLVERTTRHGWDEYDSFVCVAKSPRHARLVHPSEGDYTWNGEQWQSNTGYIPYNGAGWVNPADTKATLIGRANRGQRLGVVCTSFNAG